MNECVWNTPEQQITTALGRHRAHARHRQLEVEQDHKIDGTRNSLWRVLKEGVKAAVAQYCESNSNSGTRCIDVSTEAAHVLLVDYRDPSGTPVDKISIKLEPFDAPRHITMFDHRRPRRRFVVKHDSDGAIYVFDEFTGKPCSLCKLVEKVLAPEMSQVW
jgi:hypothetical protein